MLFNTLTYFEFLVIALVAFYLTPKPLRKFVLLIASYYFYISWVPRYVFVLLGLTALDYIAAIWIERGRRPKLAVVVSVCANLGLLAYFKYANFFTGHSRAVTLLLPLGISFHTFQSISYVVDVYRGQQKAVRNPVDYALYIAFFPQLVAGPIVRAHDFFANLYNWHAPTASEVQSGALLVVSGLVKKVVLADHFALVADSYFSHVIAQPGMLQAWTATLAFAMQIFFDFSGYTDIAIGCALLFGFHFPVNFKRPYLAAGISEFWRRWHISLSQWLRDYLYIPLGGSRHGRWQTYRNLMITMLLGGLWHGASWNFVIWGGYHGALLSVERATRKFALEVTFVLVVLGWVFFRAPTLPDSFFVFQQMFTGQVGKSLLSPVLCVVIALVTAIAVAEERLHISDRIAAKPAWIAGGAMAMLLLTLELFGVFDTTIPFVYFQF